MKNEYDFQRQRRKIEDIFHLSLTAFFPGLLLNLFKKLLTWLIISFHWYSHLDSLLKRKTKADYILTDKPNSAVSHCSQIENSRWTIEVQNAKCVFASLPLCVCCELGCVDFGVAAVCMLSLISIKG